MAKRNYQQRESGLLVPGNDSVKLSKPTPPKPWYAQGKLWPMMWRGMSRRKCCCPEEDSSSSQPLVVNCFANCNELLPEIVYLRLFHVGDSTCDSGVCADIFADWFALVVRFDIGCFWDYKEDVECLADCTQPNHWLRIWSRIGVVGGGNPWFQVVTQENYCNATGIEALQIWNFGFQYPLATGNTCRWEGNKDIPARPGEGSLCGAAAGDTSCIGRW